MECDWDFLCFEPVEMSDDERVAGICDELEDEDLDFIVDFLD